MTWCHTTLLVISPWAKHGYVSHRHTTIVSMHRTLYEIFGLPPLNMFDALANDFADCFTTKPDFRPYKCEPVDPRIRTLVGIVRLPLRFPVDRFVGPACVIDVAARAKANPDFLLTREIVEEWESKHGRIPAHAWVLIRTDWSQRKGAQAYLNASEDGSHTPGFDPKCVPFLAKERDILGVGVETVGTDAGQAYRFDPTFPCHTIMHGSNKFGLASLTNLDQLPPTGAVVFAPPLKIVNGSGSPLRVLALVPA